MKKIVTLIAISLISSNVLAKEVFLDCDTIVQVDFLSESKGDNHLFKFDIDFTAKKGKMPGWTNSLYKEDPNNPEYALSLGETIIGFGSSNTGLNCSINRESLKSMCTYRDSGSNIYTFYTGDCKVVDKRVNNKTKF